MDNNLKSLPLVQSARISFKSNVNYLRGLAALAVAAYHAVTFYDFAYGNGIKPSHFMEMLGVYGVALFFAISGYLMSGIIRRQPPFEFIVRRVLRIYPLFILATVAVVIAHTKIWQTYNVLSMSLAPVGYTEYPLGFVEWTLVYEVFFYVALFGIGLLNLVERIDFIAAIWLLVILLAAILGVPDMRLPTITHLPILSVNIGLAGGLLIPRLSNMSVLPKLVLALLFIAISFLAIYPPVVRLTAGIGGVLLVAAAVGSRDILPALTQPIFKKLGDWSYAMYLIHIPVFIVIFRPMFSGYGFPILFMGIAAVIVAAAILGQIDIETHDRTRRMKVDNSDWRVMGSALAFVAFYLAICIAYT